VEAATKVVGNATVYGSTHCAADIRLSQLPFGSNWQKGATMAGADLLGIWNPGPRQFDAYYQMPDSTWRKSTDARTDQGNLAIAAGTVTAIARTQAVSRAAAFLLSGMPYTMDQVRWGPFNAGAAAVAPAILLAPRVSLYLQGQLHGNSLRRQRFRGRA
ncbi:MAG: hypothetical protein WDO13_16645, partial [Verrucomicrobiota bacterium]